MDDSVIMTIRAQMVGLGKAFQAALARLKDKRKVLTAAIDVVRSEKAAGKHRYEES